MTGKSHPEGLTVTANNVFPKEPIINKGTAEWFRLNIRNLPAKRLEAERALWGTIQETAILEDSERAEIKAVLQVIEDYLDEIMVVKPAQIEDHDRLTGHRSSDNWPTWLHASTLRIHWHWCELLETWNLNPFKRQESFGTASVDESAEAEGITRFAFPSKQSMSDFIDANQLDDFVEGKLEIQFCYLTLANVFARADAAAFLNILKHATNQLAIIHDERMRAIRNDGGRVGVITASHFGQREAHELNRITRARQELGAKYIAK